MLNFSDIGRYRENNRIEAKKALGGLPHSIWETCSAFANTLGGVILLGVEECADKSFRPVDLPDPEGMVQAFAHGLRDPEKISSCIVPEENVQIHEVEGNRIIEIVVPRAQRSSKPVYIGADPWTGTYRRSGEGDYRCTPEQVQAMLRDAASVTQDMTVLEAMEPDVLDRESIRRYREKCGQGWQGLEYSLFLQQLGAAGTGADGRLHPTAAGLLMFGSAARITEVFPHYYLEYQEETQGAEAVRICSDSGDWSGNLFDFYCRVQPRISREVSDDASVRNALQEALINSLTHADYHGAQGLVIQKTGKAVTISNPGGFRVDLNKAKRSGLSDPRNAALIKMFRLIHVRAGRGIQGIYRAWRDRGWKEPTIAESFAPERTTLTLTMEQNSDRLALRNRIVDHLTVHICATQQELTQLVGPADGPELLQQMLDDAILVTQTVDGSAVYKLKEKAGN